MSDKNQKKTISIDMNLFKIPDNTRKRRPKPDLQIKMKTREDKKPNRDKTTKKRILRMIRERQENEYDKLYNNQKEVKNDQSKRQNHVDDFNKDFEESLNFFSALEKKQENSISTHHSDRQHTLRQYPTPSNNLLFQPSSTITNEDVNIELPNVFDSVIAPMEYTHYSYPSTLESNNIASSLQYNPSTSMKLSVYDPTIIPNSGNLKNGTLPTHRQYNKTQKNTNILDWNRQMKQSELRKQAEYMKNHLPKLGSAPRKRKKQRKIYKRTFKIGRSKTRPSVAVLVSNRTIRNHITNKTQMYKQLPIQEVKHYLIRKGLIKIGTTAPNDVLRKMYESVHLICGEVQNHNPENLLYNFIHGEK
jgi:hypothetical protein